MGKPLFVVLRSQRMTDEEKEDLQKIMNTDQKVGNLRTFLNGIRCIFEESQNENEARCVLDKLKTIRTDSNKSAAFKKVIKFLDNHFDWMTAFLSHEEVKRNSLSETSMRTLRRLEIEHDGFRCFDMARKFFTHLSGYQVPRMECL